MHPKLLNMLHSLSLTTASLITLALGMNQMSLSSPVTRMCGEIIRKTVCSDINFPTQAFYLHSSGTCAFTICFLLWIRTLNINILKIILKSDHPTYDGAQNIVYNFIQIWNKQMSNSTYAE